MDLQPSDEAQPRWKPQDSARGRLDLGRWGARIALMIWMPAVALGVGSLMVGHWAPLPVPSTEAHTPLASGIESLLGGEDTATRSQWTLVHFLYGDCGCSSRVADYLVSESRTQPEEIVEHIIFVDQDPESEFALNALAQGFAVHHETRPTLAERYGIESAPLFIAVSPEGDVKFLGGYTLRKQGLDYADLDVLAQLRAGRQPDPIPVFGCGVSATLQTALDPLRIKYR